MQAMTKKIVKNPVKNPNRGDSRMSKALEAKLKNPDLTLFDALLLGGYEYESDRQPHATDSDNVALRQRKNQLCRRLRTVKQNQLLAASNECEPIESTENTTNDDDVATAETKSDKKSTKRHRGQKPSTKGGGGGGGGGSKGSAKPRPQKRKSAAALDTKDHQQDDLPAILEQPATTKPVAVAERPADGIQGDASVITDTGITTDTTVDSDTGIKRTASDSSLFSLDGIDFEGIPEYMQKESRKHMRKKIRLYVSAPPSCGWHGSQDAPKFRGPTASAYAGPSPLASNISHQEFLERAVAGPSVPCAGASFGAYPYPLIKGRSPQPCFPTGQQSLKSMMALAYRNGSPGRQVRRFPSFHNSAPRYGTSETIERIVDSSRMESLRTILELASAQSTPVFSEQAENMEPLNDLESYNDDKTSHEVEEAECWGKRMWMIDP